MYPLNVSIFVVILFCKERTNVHLESKVGIYQMFLLYVANLVIYTHEVGPLVLLMNLLLLLLLFQDHNWL